MAVHVGAVPRAGHKGVVPRAGHKGAIWVVRVGAVPAGHIVVHMGAVPRAGHKGIVQRAQRAGHVRAVSGAGHKGVVRVGAVPRAGREGVVHKGVDHKIPKERSLTHTAQEHTGSPRQIITLKQCPSDLFCLGAQATIPLDCKMWHTTGVGGLMN